MQQRSTEKLSDLRQMLLEIKSLVVFTGAGISAASGIPTYRGEDGVWQKYDPDKYASINYFFKDPQYYWRFFKEVRYPLLEKAAPNEAHFALAELEKRGLLGAVITQNIDGLHQLAGSERVLELHGNTRRISCLDCRAQYTMEEVYRQIQTQLPPACVGCGGILKPEVVFFGESLPTDVLNQATAWASRCDLFMVVGSSLVVYPAAGLPDLAKQAGAKLVIVNKEPTPLDSSADLVFNCAADDVLVEVI